MKHFNTTATALLIAVSVMSALFTSCSKDDTSSSGGSTSYKSEEVFTGTCTVSGKTTEDVKMYYIEALNEYYIDCFFEGDGAFNFNWDKTTNKISMVDCFTGLYNYYNPIYFLSQSAYEMQMGTDAKPSYYDPENNVFTFNVLCETSDDGTTVYRIPLTITYVPVITK